jgi:Pentapeptide repeats (8 copies)
MEHSKGPPKSRGGEAAEAEQRHPIDYSTASAEVTGGASAVDEQKELELRRLRAETTKAEYDAANAQRSARRHLLTETLPVITALVAVGGLIVSLLSHTRELKRQREERARADSVQYADALAAEVSRFSEASLQGRIGAIANLRRYWSDTAARSIVRALILSHINVEHDPTVRESLRELILQSPDSATLAALADQNRFIQSRILRLSRRPIKLLLWPRRLPRGDSLLGRATDDLTWNISVLAESLRRLRIVEGIDFSNVLFARPILDTTLPGRPEVRSYGDGGIYRDMTFAGVRLRGASFAGAYLERVNFIDADLDSTVLAGTYFNNCEFRGRTTLAAFVTYLEPYGLDSGPFAMGPFNPTWHHASIEVEEFYPRLSKWEWRPGLDTAVFFVLQGSRWQIRTQHRAGNGYPESLLPPARNDTSGQFVGQLPRFVPLDFP